MNISINYQLCSAVNVMKQKGCNLGNLVQCGVYLRL